MGYTNITATNGVAAGRDISGSTINVGMSPEQVQALVVAFTQPLTQQLGAATEARAEAAQVARLAARLGFTRDAVVGFLRILGERDVPVEQMPVRLGEIATRSRDLNTRLAALESGRPRGRGAGRRSEAGERGRQVRRGRRAARAGEGDEPAVEGQGGGESGPAAAGGGGDPGRGAGRWR